MKVVAAYLLAVLGGNDTPSAKTIKDILGSGACRQLLLFLFYFIFIFVKFLLNVVYKD
jgi:hypothetical protein